MIDYKHSIVLETHSLLTLKPITLGRVVQCDKGFLSQIKKYNRWINISSSLATLEEARNFLKQHHEKKAQLKRGWNDTQLTAAKEKAELKNLKLWSDRLQFRIQLQRTLEANLSNVKFQVSEMLNDPAVQQLSRKELSTILIPLYQSVFFDTLETSKIGLLRSMCELLNWCNNHVCQKQKLDRIAKVD